nr:MAG TPA: hypothetical protein [Caudoviricetes sp.]
MRIRCLQNELAILWTCHNLWQLWGSRLSHSALRNFFSLELAYSKVGSRDDHLPFCLTLAIQIIAYCVAAVNFVYF